MVAHQLSQTEVDLFSEVGDFVCEKTHKVFTAKSSRTRRLNGADLAMVLNRKRGLFL